MAVTLDAMFGGAVRKTAGALLVVGEARVLSFFTSSTIGISLPDPAKLLPGGPYFFLVAGTIGIRNVVDHLGNPLGTLNGSSTPDIGVVFLRADKTWEMVKRVSGTPRSVGSQTRTTTICEDLTTSSPESPANCSAASYQLDPCPSYADRTPIFTNSNLSSYTGKAIRVVGDATDRCYLVDNTPISGEYQTQSVTVASSSDTCDDCMRTFRLVKCFGSSGAPEAIVTRTNLSLYVGQVVRISAYLGVCYEVTEFESDDTGSAVTVNDFFETCLDCVAGVGDCAGGGYFDCPDPPCCEFLAGCEEEWECPAVDYQGHPLIGCNACTELCPFCPCTCIYISAGGECSGIPCPG